MSQSVSGPLDLRISDKAVAPHHGVPPALAWVVLVLAIAALVSLGVAGLLRTGQPYADVRYWFVATRSFFEGVDPYDYAAFQQAAQALQLGFIERFPYPPHGFGFGALFSFFPYPVARVVFTVLSLVSLTGIAVWMAAQVMRAGHTRSVAVLAVAAFVGSPPVLHVLWTGQIALTFGACLLAGWELAHRGRWLPAAVFLAIASIKPQFSLFVLVWLMLERRWKALVACAVVVGLMAAVPLAHFDPLHLLQGWLRMVREYQLEPSKASGLSYNTTLSSLFQGTGLPQIPVGFSVGGGLLLVVALWWTIRRRTDAPQLAAPALAAGAQSGQLPGSRSPADSSCLLVLAGLGLLLVSGRDYDLTLILPLAFVWLARQTDRFNVLCGLGLVLSWYVPHRAMQMTQLNLLLYWRVITLAFLVALVAHSLWRNQRGVAAPAGRHRVG